LGREEMEAKSGGAVDISLGCVRGANLTRTCKRNFNKHHLKGEKRTVGNVWGGGKGQDGCLGYFEVRLVPL